MQIDGQGAAEQAGAAGARRTGWAPVPNLHFHQLAYLVAVAEEPTLTAAAERLGISQPALSQALAQMERRLEARLFEHAGRRRVPTEAGRLVIAFARDALGRAAEMGRQLERTRAGRAGRLRVGMIDAATLYLVPEAIREHRRLHPGVDLAVAVDSSGALMQRVLAFDLDLAVVVGPAEPGLSAMSLGWEPLYLYGPPVAGAATPGGRGSGRGTSAEATGAADTGAADTGAANAGAAATGAADTGAAATGAADTGAANAGAADTGAADTGASAAAWALYPPGSRTRQAIDVALGRGGGGAAAALVSGNPQILRQHVALGLGWSVLPRDVAEAGARPLVPAGAGVGAAPVAPVAAREVMVVTRPGAAEEPPVAAFLALVVAEGRSRLRERAPDPPAAAGTAGSGAGEAENPAEI